MSADHKDKRLRTSALLSWGDWRVNIDAGPDFRQQMLSAGVEKLDGVLMTHEHNDHMAGMDDTPLDPTTADPRELMQALLPAARALVQLGRGAEAGSDAPTARARCRWCRRP